ncbi:putative pectinesterase/pectinesterase inhibitor 61 [Forsythia ovata]|uniref:Pectinesterase/pectinesterase inhibitor 61 n=1 Tax=Forsythia ovata TaxID=205694 RepID=A0ABD1X2Q2_9LAMI
MGYSRFGSTEPEASPRRTLPDKESTSNPKKSKLKFLLIIAATLIVASAVSAALVMGLRTRANSGSMHPTQAISRTCSRTRYPTLCVNSLMDFPGALSASDKGPRPHFRQRDLTAFRQGSVRSIGDQQSRDGHTRPVCVR